MKQALQQLHTSNSSPSLSHLAGRILQVIPLETMRNNQCIIVRVMPFGYGTSASVRQTVARKWSSSQVWLIAENKAGER